MNNFIFENKTKVYFGKGCVGEYLPKIAAVHGDKVLLAYGGGSIKKNGVYEEVIAALEKAGKTIIEFPGIMENPTYKKVLEGKTGGLDPCSRRRLGYGLQQGNFHGSGQRERCVG